ETNSRRMTSSAVAACSDAPLNKARRTSPSVIDPITRAASSRTNAMDSPVASRTLSTSSKVAPAATVRRASSAAPVPPHRINYSPDGSGKSTAHVYGIASRDIITLLQSLKLFDRTLEDTPDKSRFVSDFESALTRAARREIAQRERRTRLDWARINDHAPNCAMRVALAVCHLFHA